MPTMSESQKRTAKTRKARWSKQVKPYYAECLSCSLNCSVLLTRSEGSYDLMRCPKKHGPAVQYAGLVNATEEEIEKVKKEIEKNGKRK